MSCIFPWNINSSNVSHSTKLLHQLVKLQSENKGEREKRKIEVHTFFQRILKWLKYFCVVTKSVNIGWFVRSIEKADCHSDSSYANVNKS